MNGLEIRGGPPVTGHGAICCVAPLIVHLHLAWLCNCVRCIQGNIFLYVFRRMFRVSEFQVVPAPL